MTRKYNRIFYYIYLLQLGLILYFYDKKKHNIFFNIKIGNTILITPVCIIYKQKK